jgi:thiamine pyrophosphate-dependent acetolactate synthase large subunit-like protein
VRSGADALCRVLRRRGIGTIFGLPGSQNVVLYEALRRSGFRTVLATHELAAAFMAMGHVRASGRLAPLITIPGPGFTWALTALAEARHDSTALLHLVGAPPTGPRRFQFQELDQAAIAAPIAKACLSVGAGRDVERVVNEGIDIALGGEPGPVVLELDPGALDEPAPERGVSQAPAPSPPGDSVREAARRLGEARRPVLLVGGGCRDAADEVRALAERLRAPVTTTVSGRGIVAEDHDLAMGFDAVRGDVALLSRLLRDSDCVLIVGCKLGASSTVLFRLELAEATAIRVDTSAEVLAAGYPASLSVVADAGAFLRALRGSLPATASAWTGPELARWRAAFRAPSPAVEPRFPDLQPPESATLVRAVRAALPRDGLVVTDSGLHQELVRRHLEVLAPSTLLTPADFQSMGFGLPAAIGAAIACPDRPVVAIIGDGGLAMTGMELLTAVRECANLTVVVLNDGYLNRIRLQQVAQFGRAASVELRNPDFAALASAVGAAYVLLGGAATEAMHEIVAREGVTVAEVLVGDSPAIRRLQARGLFMGPARRAAGARLRNWWRKRRPPVAR